MGEPISVWSKGIFPKRIPLICSKPTRGRNVKNWFDSDDDADDTKSIHSSEATLTGDEEMGYAKNEKSFGTKTTTTEVSAGSGIAPSWARGVNVTREVVVETSSR
jgi:hypothetical protein